MCIKFYFLYLVILIKIIYITIIISLIYVNKLLSILFHFINCLLYIYINHFLLTTKIDLIYIYTIL
jgi:hypothetical protein